LENVDDIETADMYTQPQLLIGGERHLEVFVLVDVNVHRLLAREPMYQFNFSNAGSDESRSLRSACEIPTSAIDYRSWCHLKLRPRILVLCSSYKKQAPSNITYYRSEQQGEISGVWLKVNDMAAKLEICGRENLPSRICCILSKIPFLA
jgi:hypothetical protein